MCNTDIRIGDKIMYVGNEQEEYFTFNNFQSLSVIFDGFSIIYLLISFVDLQ